MRFVKSLVRSLELIDVLFGMLADIYLADILKVD